MKPAASLAKYFPLLLLYLLTSCAPKLTFYVTRPPQLPVENVETISLGSFEDKFAQEIALPQSLGSRRLEGHASLQPMISRFESNARAADLVRTMLVAGLSKSAQYRLLDTGETGESFSGITPDAVSTAIINAKIKYSEHTFEDSEKTFHVLLATKGGLGFQEQAILFATKSGVIASAERNKKGFQVNSPYIEKIAAMEVEFDLVRKSTGKKIVKTQTLRSYYVRKWGRKKDTTHLPQTLNEVIVEDFQEDTSLFNTLMAQAGKLELALMDPDEFLALGGKLKNNPSVPMNSLDIKVKLAKHIVDRYLKKISRYTEEAELRIASGDAIAGNFLKGNAYERAINRLENIDRSEEDSFNLALAYESIAENTQATKYYQEALDKNPGNQIYMEALQRVRRR